MKLIDLDKAMSICDEDNNAVIFANTKNAEVKAIPIEWIRNYVSTWISEPYKNFALNMINVWEKENEANRR